MVSICHKQSLPPLYIELMPLHVIIAPFNVGAKGKVRVETIEEFLTDVSTAVIEFDYNISTCVLP